MNNFTMPFGGAVDDDGIEQPFATHLRDKASLFDQRVHRSGYVSKPGRIIRWPDDCYKKACPGDGENPKGLEPDHGL